MFAPFWLHFRRPGDTFWSLWGRPVLQVAGGGVFSGSEEADREIAGVWGTGGGDLGGPGRRIAGGGQRSHTPVDPKGSAHYPNEGPRTKGRPQRANTGPGGPLLGPPTHGIKEAWLMSSNGLDIDLLFLLPNHDLASGHFLLGDVIKTSF